MTDIYLNAVNLSMFLIKCKTFQLDPLHFAIGHEIHKLVLQRFSNIEFYFNSSNITYLTPQIKFYFYKQNKILKGVGTLLQVMALNSYVLCL